MAGIDRGADSALMLVENQGCRQGGKRRDTDDRHSASNPDGPRRSNADPQTREGARPDRDRHPVESRKTALDPRHHAIDQRQKRLGMTAFHGNRFQRFRRLGPVVEDTGRGCGKRGVNRQDFHD